MLEGEECVMSEGLENQDEPGYYMVRAMDQTEEDFEIFFDKSVVAIGWSSVDFTGFDDPESLANHIEEKYYADDDRDPRYIGKLTGQVARFKSIEEGDRILVPYLEGVRLAVASGEERHDEDAGERRDLANQHKVQYLGEDGEPVTTPRKNLPNALQKRLRVPGSFVLDLSEFSDVIEQVFETPDWTFGRETLHQTEAEVQQFKDELLNRLQTGETQFAAGGRGMEELTCELLEIEGYKAEVLPKREFPGKADADVRATKSDPIHDITALVQVKAHDGKTGTEGAKQLTRITDEAPEYADSSFVLLTSGDPSSDLQEYCSQNEIVLVGGEDLIDWIYDDLDQLSSETRQKLGIVEVPRLLS